MTETHSLGEWEKEFDQFYSLPENMVPGPQREKAIKTFIRKLLLAQKEGFRREIEGMELIRNPQKDLLQSEIAHIDGFNEAIDRVLTKLDTNVI